MTSQIDPTLPIAGTPTTASVRANFQTAHDEITALQAGAAAITATQVAISPVIGTLGPNVQAALTTVNSNFAPLASPNLTGNPTAPTAATGDSDTSIATTAFVQAAVTPALHDVGRNLLHNALFQVAQRGAGGFTTSGAYTADRWVMWITLDTLNVSISTLGDTGRTQIGDEAATSGLAISVTGNAGATALSIVEQRIEGVRRLAGKTVTVSFWAVGSAALKVGVSLTQNFGSGGSPSPIMGGNGQAVTVATTWARYSLTFIVPSSAGKTLGTNAGTDFTALDFWLSAGANNNTGSGNVGVQSGSFTFWGIQLEIGTQATPLEKPDPRYDLANCQRFYQTGNFNVSGYNVAGGTCAITTALLAPMRATPTVVPTTGGATNASALTAQAVSPVALNVQFAATATGQAVYYGPYTASADL